MLSLTRYNFIQNMCNTVKAWDTIGALGVTLIDLKLHKNLAFHNTEVQVIVSVNNFCPMSYFMHMHSDWIGQITEVPTYTSLGKHIIAVFFLHKINFKGYVKYSGVYNIKVYSFV